MGDPVHIEKRNENWADKSAASKPDYISGDKSNPHEEPKAKQDATYTDHGRGK